MNLLLSGDTITNVGSKNTIDVKNGDRFVIHTPGGGGYGDKNKRNEEKESQEVNPLNVNVSLGSEQAFKRK